MTRFARIVTAGLAAGAVAVATLVAGAVPAGATTRYLEIDCGSWASWTITAAPGDTIVIADINRDTANCTEARTEVEYAGAFTTAGAFNGWAWTWTWVLAADAPAGDYAPRTMQLIRATSSPIINSILLTVETADAPGGGDGTGGGDTTATAPLPADAVQQVPMPTSGACAAVDDAALAWGTGRAGGWTHSWAQWGGPGDGGPVCTRTLHWAGPGWVVR